MRTSPGFPKAVVNTCGNEGVEAQAFKKGEEARVLPKEVEALSSPVGQKHPCSERGGGPRVVKGSEPHAFPEVFSLRRSPSGGSTGMPTWTESGPYQRGPSIGVSKGAEALAFPKG